MPNHTVRIQNVAMPRNSISPHLLFLPFPATFNSPDMAMPSSSDMATMSLDMSEHETGANNSFIDEIRGAVELFVMTLNQIALTHGRCEFLFIMLLRRPYSDPQCSSQEYVRILGGIGGFKKVIQGSTTPFGAFCSKKLGEINRGTLFFLIAVLLLQALTVYYTPLR